MSTDIVSESDDAKRPRRKNRFSRYPKTTALVILITLVIFSEIVCYFVIVAVGHQDRRKGYQYNRQISGYTVFKNTPNFDMGSSTIKVDEKDPDVVLDKHGFLTDVPLTEEKTKGVIRIFILGGSAAFGGGQDQRYHSTHSYPAGVYSYPRSIAGQLKAYLQKRKPDTTFEVINAAAYRRQFHQSFLLYLESISKLSPDFVVNIEGWNDISTFVGGQPYESGEALLPSLIELQNDSDSWLHRSNTYYVFSKAYDQLRVGNSKSKQAIMYDERAYSEDGYAKRRDIFIENSARFEQILKQYLAVLQADKTRFVFVLQPILQRTKWNKPFSATEKRLLAVAPLGRPDSKGFADKIFVAKFFFDDYLSDRIASIVASQGESFIDANRELRSLDESVEVYSDYCHLLPDGSRFLGMKIGEEILARLPPSPKDDPR